MNSKIDATPPLAAPPCSATVISVFASFPNGDRLHERFPTRKAAEEGIRDARAKGGLNINVFDPWTKKRAAQNSVISKP